MLPWPEPIEIGEFLAAKSHTAAKPQPKYQPISPVWFFRVFRVFRGPFRTGRFGAASFGGRSHPARRRRHETLAEDVLVHHFGEASFGDLVPSGRHADLFNANRRRFEEKWGMAWQPHGRRQADEYLETIEGIRRAVGASVPAGSMVLVVSKGDDDLVRFDGRSGAHFPQAESGVYAGHHPADSNEAIAELEHHRSIGAEFLVIPRTALWWLDHYADLRTHLERGGAVVRTDECVIYRLGTRTADSAARSLVS